jgi:hypothetical protein
VEVETSTNVFKPLLIAGGGGGGGGVVTNAALGEDLGGSDGESGTPGANSGSLTGGQGGQGGSLGGAGGSGGQTVCGGFPGNAGGAGEASGSVVAGEAYGSGGYGGTNSIEASGGGGGGGGYIGGGGGGAGSWYGGGPCTGESTNGGGGGGGSSYIEPEALNQVTREPESHEPAEVVIAYTRIATIESVPSSLSFAPTAPVGSAVDSPRIIVLGNRGAAPLELTNLEIHGTDAHDFTISEDHCGLPVQFNQTCSLGVSFVPQEAGPQNATLVIGSNAGSGPMAIPLSGTGVALLEVPSVTRQTGAGVDGPSGRGSDSQPATLSCDQTTAEEAARESTLPERLHSRYHDLRFSQFSADKPICHSLVGGVRTMAVLYGCCTVTAPTPLAVFETAGSKWHLVYLLLSRLVYSMRLQGNSVIEKTPVYKRSDALCCASHYRIYRLRWNGHKFTTVRGPLLKASSRYKNGRR